MGKSKSSQRWLREHFDDPYVQQAQNAGYRARSAFKLVEIQHKDRIIRPGMRIVDLGSAPGGWSQVALNELGGTGQVIALDVLPMDAIEGVRFIQGDFTEDEPLAALEQALDGQPIDLVLSDMAPNMSGMQAIDQPRAMYLAELALDFAAQWLKPGGSFLVKLFQGEGFDAYLADCRRRFAKVVMRKPRSSRPRSREVYLLAKQLRMN